MYIMFKYSLTNPNLSPYPPRTLPLTHESISYSMKTFLNNNYQFKNMLYYLKIFCNHLNR